ncbi:MAG: hypothetical protein PHD86_01500, partial [Kiritimatiellae bacterium]|nr:hypothetical protein [Kiritimatiellia bacterium]
GDDDAGSGAHGAAHRDMGETKDDTGECLLAASRAFRKGSAQTRTGSKRSLDQQTSKTGRIKSVKMCLTFIDNQRCRCFLPRIRKKSPKICKKDRKMQKNVKKMPKNGQNRQKTPFFLFFLEKMSFFCCINACHAQRLFGLFRRRYEEAAARIAGVFLPFSDQFCFRRTLC